MAPKRKVQERELSSTTNAGTGKQGMILVLQENISEALAVAPAYATTTRNGSWYGQAQASSDIWPSVAG